MANLKQNDDTSLGVEGAVAGADGFLPVTIPYTASIVDSSLFTAYRPMTVASIIGRVDVLGTGGACTAIIRKVPSGTIGTSGTALHSGTYNLVGTINTNQTLTLSATAGVVQMAAGDSLYFDLTGTPTSAVGNVTVMLRPA